MTCLIGDFWPFFSGTILPLALIGALLASTVWEYAFNAFSSGTLNRLSVPMIIEPLYWSGDVLAVDSGSGWPAPLLGPAPSPLALVTSSSLPWTVIELGYHAVGMAPRTRRCLRST